MKKAMKKTIVVLVSLILVLAGCSNVVKNDVMVDEISSNQIMPTPTVTSEPTATPFVKLDKPKYVFIVIGDGMGKGTASLGEMYVRISEGDMEAKAEWENFDVQKIVDAGCDSSQGGTMLACGYESRSGYISLDRNGDPMYTIMDRAKEAGYATGVVTNSSLADATPATFTSHTDSRYNYPEVIAQTSKSNVDYLAGGGLRFYASKAETSNMPTEDCYGIETYYGGSKTLTQELSDVGYHRYYGKEGAEVMLNHLKNGDISYERAIYSVSLVYMPWEIDKYNARNIEDFIYVPDLCEMTQLGIETLSQNQKGFVMMVEEAFIDKAAHYDSQIRGIYQVALLNETMKVIMDFYNEHPYETLVILTADHETGNYMYNEELFNEFKELPDFEWQDNGDDLSHFLINEWGFRDYESYYYGEMNNSQKDVWENEDDSRVQLYAALTETASVKYGTIITTVAHSLQDVPMYATGNGSEAFTDCENILDVPIKICEVMGWKSLPETIPEEMLIH